MHRESRREREGERGHIFSSGIKEKRFHVNFIIFTLRRQNEHVAYDGSYLYAYVCIVYIHVCVCVCVCGADMPLKY